MIGAFVAIVSLNMTRELVEDYGVMVTPALLISGATATTPIVVTSIAHGIPLGRLIHGIIDGVTGMTEANGLWVCTPLDPDTFALSTFDAQGNSVSSVGVDAYVSGGQIRYAFPDGQILLGRRNKMLATMVASPRVVMIPTTGSAWTFEPYGGAAPNIVPASVPRLRGSAEQQAMTSQPQMATELLTFEVYINGSGPNYGDPLGPDFEDFDATQAIAHCFYAQLFDAVGGLPRARILRESWPSQEEGQAAMTQRGQQWMGIVQIQMPVYRSAIAFAPQGVGATILVQPQNPATEDPITINVG